MKSHATIVAKDNMISRFINLHSFSIYLFIVLQTHFAFFSSVTLKTILISCLNRSAINISLSFFLSFSFQKKKKKKKQKQKQKKKSVYKLYQTGPREGGQFNYCMNEEMPKKEVIYRVRLINWHVGGGTFSMTLHL